MTLRDQRDTPLLLRAAADHIERLEQEIAAERERLAIKAVEESEVIRAIYRRGYFAGYAAGRNGRARETAPERRCRGELASALR
jgi:hypothetical protein